jgi:23S rRNA G2445 N2-methylase RlmL
MLTRSACASVRAILSPSVGSRTFAVSAASQGPARAPTLADITPDSAASFNEKQKSFRDGLVAAQKRKEQEESASRLLL